MKATKTLVRRVDDFIAYPNSFDELTSARKKLLADSALTMWKVLKDFGNLLDAANRLGAEQRIPEIADGFQTFIWSKFYVTFKQVNDATRAKDPVVQLSYSLPEAQYDIAATEILIVASNISDWRPNFSLFNLFFQRLRWVVNACKDMVQKPKDEGLLILAAYVLATTANCLISAKECKEQRISSMPQIASHLGEVVSEIRRLLQDGVVVNKPALVSYLASTLYTAKLDPIDPEIGSRNLDGVAKIEPVSLSASDRSWVSCNLWECRHKDFGRWTEFLDIPKNLPAMSLAQFVRAGNYALLGPLKERPELGVDIGMEPKVSRLDVLSVVETFFPKLRSIASARIADEEARAVEKLYDYQIRSALAEVISANESLSSITREVANQEATKPHSGYEVSDMDIPFSQRDRRYYACFVVKSGREIQSTSVPETVLSQVMRPFSRLKNAMSVLVTAKPLSTPLRNDINGFVSRGVPIFVIEGSTLAKLLREYGKLTS